MISIPHLCLVRSCALPTKRTAVVTKQFQSSSNTQTQICWQEIQSEETIK
jgi:hypothetical protein